MAGAGMGVGCIELSPEPSSGDIIEITLSRINVWIPVDTTSQWMNTYPADPPDYIACTISVRFDNQDEDAGKEFEFSFQSISGDAWNIVRSEKSSYTVPQDGDLQLIIWVIPDNSSTTGTAHEYGWRFHPGLEYEVYSESQDYGQDYGGTVHLHKLIYVEMDRLTFTTGASGPIPNWEGYADRVLEGSATTGEQVSGGENTFCQIERNVAYDGSMFAEYNPDSTFPISVVGNQDFVLQTYQIDPWPEDLLWLADWQDYNSSYRNTGTLYDDHYFPVYLVGTDYIEDEHPYLYAGYTEIFWTSPPVRCYRVAVVASQYIQDLMTGSYEWARPNLYGATFAHEMGHYLVGMTDDPLPHGANCIMRSWTDPMDYVTSRSFCSFCKSKFYEKRDFISNEWFFGGTFSHDLPRDQEQEAK